MTDGRPTFEQPELPFPEKAPVRDVLVARKRPWTIPELARELGPSVWTLYRARDNGALAVTRIELPGRTRPMYRVEVRDAVEFYDEHFSAYHERF